MIEKQQEPVAWLWELTGEVTTDPDRADGMWIPLVPQRQPLTDEQEREAIAVWLEQECDEQYLADRVRARGK